MYIRKAVNRKKNGSPRGQKNPKTIFYINTPK